MANGRLTAMTSGEATRGDAFRAAGRHSRRVRALRIIVPTVAAVLAAGAILVSWWDPLRAWNFPITIGPVTVSGSRVTMEAPRLSGFTNDNRIYHVAATRADHDVTRPHIIGLTAIEADMEMAEGGMASIRAAKGVLDAKTSIVELMGPIQVSTTDGQTGRAQHALIDTRAGTIRSDQAVTFVSPRGELTGARMEIRDNGKVILLEGAVRGNFMPAPPDDGASAAPPDPR